MDNYLTGEFRKDFNEDKPCPRCKKPLDMGRQGSLSRRDNKTEICSACGTAEAMEDFTPILDKMLNKF